MRPSIVKADGRRVDNTQELINPRQNINPAATIFVLSASYQKV